MHLIYRAAIFSLAALLILSGIAVLVLAEMTSHTTARSLLGGVVTVVCGVALGAAAWLKRGPRWLVRLLNP